MVENAMESICEIPLYGRDGEVRAVTRVDPDDWFELARYRWSLGSHGYVCGRMATHRYRRTSQRGCRSDGAPKQVLLHRYLMGIWHGDRRQVDHINLDRLDNRRANLRIGTHAANAQNLAPQTGRTSAYRGVHWFSDPRRPGWGCWHATCQLNGRTHSLGYFQDEEDAAAAAAAFRAQHMPFSPEAQEAGR